MGLWRRVLERIVGSVLVNRHFGKSQDDLEELS